MDGLDKSLISIDESFEGFRAEAWALSLAKFEFET